MSCRRLIEAIDDHAEKQRDDGRADEVQPAEASQLSSPFAIAASTSAIAQPGSSFVTVFIKISSNVWFFLFCGFIIARIYDKIKS